jgi:hypothetical protein
MSQTSKLKVQIEYGELKHTVEGEVDDVLREVIKFVSKIFPKYEVASKMIFTPDYLAMITDISAFINISPNGEVILLKCTLSADEAIGLILLGAHVASKIGKKESDELSVEEISRSIGKAVKTIRNTIAEMSKAGIVERTGKGSYRITTTGMREVHEAAKALLETESSQTGG